MNGNNGDGYDDDGPQVMICGEYMDIDIDVFHRRPSNSGNTRVIRDSFIHNTLLIVLENIHLKSGIIPIIPIIPALLLIITILVYSCIPKLRSLQGKCMICYLIVLATSCALFAYLSINDQYYGGIHSANTCRLIAFILLMSLLSTFLWLNVLNFNLWLSI